MGAELTPLSAQPNAERQEAEKHNKLILPRSLDLDIKSRLSLDAIMLIAGKQDTGWAQDVFASRLQSGWSLAEINYLLYGRGVNGILVCTGFYPQDYNFFHYLDITNAEDTARKDICPDDPEFPHFHSFLNNAVGNPFPDEDFLGWLHNHPNGLTIQERMDTVESVGFSGADWTWINQYIENYGTNGRRLAFPIYYTSVVDTEVDFYKGVVAAQNLPPAHLEIIVE